MNWWHRLVHFMGWHWIYQYSDTYGDSDGYVYIGRRCSVCNKVDSPIRMWRIEESDRLLKNLFTR